MPFDAMTGWTPAADACPSRWGDPNEEARPRLIPTLTDKQVLANILRWMWGDRWLRGKIYDGKGGHCLMGWLLFCTEPTTNVRQFTPQSVRIMQLLYDQLPKSAQRSRIAMHITLGRYNDSHTFGTVRGLVRRAYEAM